MIIPLFKINTDKSDIKAVSDVLKSKMFWATGPEIERFEKIISKYIGIKYTTVLNSGTSALVAALTAYGIGLGDEVIVPSFTFIATADAVSAVGATPVFTDIEERNCGLDPSKIEKKINKNTKVIIAVHYAGYPCSIRKIKEIAKKNKLILIEDAAEAFGSKEGGKMIGTFGDIAAFSFCQNKIITTGEGGALVTNNLSIQKKIKQIISHGRNNSGIFYEKNKPLDYISLGQNWRMSTILAALGISQMKKVNSNINQRIKIAEYYKNHLNHLDSVKFLPDTKGNKCVFQMFPIRVKKRDELLAYLNKHKISTRVCFNPVHKCYYYKEIEYLPVTETISSDIITLPIYPGLKENELEFIIKKIITFYKNDRS